MDATTLLSGFESETGLGLCIFGCKKQREADRARTAAIAADKLQAEKLEQQRITSEEIAVQNAQAIADAEATANKTTVIIIGASAAIAATLLIVYAVKKKKTQ